MNKFICKECGTKYQSQQENPPPGIKWDDGHVCKPERYEENITEGSDTRKS